MRDLEEWVHRRAALVLIEYDALKGEATWLVVSK